MQRIHRNRIRNNLLGLDCDGQVVLAQVRFEQGTAHTVQTAAMHPSSLLAPGAERLPEPLRGYAYALSETVERWRVRGQPVVLSVPSPGVAVRSVSMPRTKNRRILHTLVGREIEGRLALGGISPLWDYYPAGGDGDTVIVAAPRDAVTGWVDLARAAGLRPLAVEPSAMAAWRCVRRQCADVAPDAGIMVVLGPRTILVASVRGGVIRAVVQAERAWEAERPLAYAAEAAAEVVRMLSFLRGREGAARVEGDRAVVFDLVGAGAGVRDQLSAQTGLSVVGCLQGGESEAEPAAGDGLAGVAVGLALWQTE